MKHLKQALSSMLALVLVASTFATPVLAAETGSASYKDGTYTGTANVEPDEKTKFTAYGINVAITVADGQISAVAYTEDNTFGGDEDNEYYSNKAMKKVGPQIIEKQSTDVDIVSKATCTSKAIIKAVDNALEGAKVEESKPEEPKPEEPKLETSFALVAKEVAYNAEGTTFEVQVTNPAEGVDYTALTIQKGTETLQKGTDYTAAWNGDTKQVAVTLLGDANQGGQSLQVFFGETEIGTVTIQAAATPVTPPVTEGDVYALMNVPFAKFYGELNNDVAVDIVSSATTKKVGGCSNVYSSGATVAGGMDLNGVVVPVKMSQDTYKAVKDLVSDAKKDYYVGTKLEETPAVYMELTYANGSYTFSNVKGSVTTVNHVDAVIKSNTTWGDYEVDLTDSNLAKASATVYGVYFTTQDGRQYAMRQSENLWKPSSYYQFAWSTGVKTTGAKGDILHGAHYASMEGKTITSITYITSDGVARYNLASGLYVAPHHTGKISAVATSDNTLTVYGVPADLKDVTVSVATQGKGSKTLANQVSIGANGSVTLDEGNAFTDGTIYNVVVSSSNYAAMTTTVKYSADGVVYLLMNVPFATFYQELNNDVAVDIVSSATTGKVGNCSNVYSSGATVAGGMDLNGVVVPVKTDLATYQTLSGLVTDSGAAYYISGATTDPAVYMELTYADGKYTFSNIKGDVTTVENVEAEITSDTNWGDYQVNLKNKEQGKAPAGVYGVYFTTQDGKQYAMRQSENLWNPGTYYEFAWSTGVRTVGVKGDILHSAHYASMEGKTITGITYITSTGVECYNLASGLYVAPHHEGEVSATATSENTFRLDGVPSDLENVTVSVATQGRGSVTLADHAAMDAEGNVTLDEGNAFAEGTVYKVVLHSSNYAAMTTTVEYTAPVENPDDNNNGGETEEPDDNNGNETENPDDNNGNETEDPDDDNTVNVDDGDNDDADSNGGKQNQKKNKKTAKQTSAVQTGDESQVLIWACALLLSGTAITALVKYKKDA